MAGLTQGWGFGLQEGQELGGASLGLGLFVCGCPDTWCPGPVSGPPTSPPWSQRAPCPDALPSDVQVPSG